LTRGRGFTGLLPGWPWEEEVIREKVVMQAGNFHTSDAKASKERMGSEDLHRSKLLFP